MQRSCKHAKRVRLCEDVRLDGFFEWGHVVVVMEVVCGAMVGKVGEATGGGWGMSTQNLKIRSFFSGGASRSPPFTTTVHHHSSPLPPPGRAIDVIDVTRAPREVLAVVVEIYVPQIGDTATS